MTTYPMPSAAPAGEDRFAPDRRDWLRLLGGVLFAAGALVLEFRKANDWSDWAQLLVVLVPCVLLYAIAFAGWRAMPVLQGWQSAFLVFAVLLLPLVFLQFVQAVKGNTGAQLNIFWVFGVSAAVAVATALVTRAWWQMLIGGIYAITAWVALWAKILSNPSADTIRWLLILFAAVVLVLAGMAGRRGRPGASDLITVAGVAAVVAGAFSLAGLNPSTSTAAGLVSDRLPRPSNGWNFYLLVVSLVLIAYSSRSRTRGPGYLGATGLVIFLGLAGANIVARLNGDDPSSFVGWPLVLLLVGAGLLAASFAMPRGSSAIGAPAAPPQPPPPPPPPGGAPPAPQ